jgi:hypothetical protein
MQFLLHGKLESAVGEALVRQGHRVHLMPELDGELPAAAGTPEELLKELARRQWCLMTSERDFIHRVYDQRISFPLCLVLLLAAADQQATAVDRLFERYKRLTPRRLYTVTPGRVKVRQLPGL